MVVSESEEKEAAVGKCDPCGQCDAGVLCAHDSHAVSEATKDHSLLLVNESKADGIMVQGVKAFVCLKHNNEKIDLFCTSCKEAICRLCAEETHLDHSCSSLEDIAMEEKDEIRNILDRVKNRKDELSERLTSVLRNEEHLMAKRESVIPKIIDYFEKLSNVVEKQKNELVEEVTYLTNARLKELVGPREHLEMNLASCERSIDCVEKAFASEDDAQILSQKNNILACLNSLNDAVEQKHPNIDDSVEFIPEHSVQEICQRFVKTCRVFGDLACPKKSTASFKEPIQLKKECVVTVICKDKMGREMKHGGQLVTPIFTGVEVQDVTSHDNQNGSYDTKFVANTCGTLTFQVLINGHPAPNCTLSVNINWVLREDIGSGTVADDGFSVRGDKVLGSWCYRIGDCTMDAGIHKWKVDVRYLGSRSRFTFKKEIEVGVIDCDGDLTSSSAIKRGLTKKWVDTCSAEVIVTLKLDMSKNELTVRSTGGLDERNNSIPPSQSIFHVQAKRVSPFLAFRGKHLSLSVIHI